MKYRVLSLMVLSGVTHAAQTACLEPVFTTPLPGQIAGVRAADLDGDGRSDLVSSSISTNEVVVRYGAAGALLGAPLSIPVNRPVRPKAMAAADLDGDGDVDLAVGHEGMLSILVQGPAGVFTPHEYSVPLSFFGGLDIGDIDGDGDLDVVAVDSSVDQLRVFSNDGAGGLSASLAGDSAVWPTNVALGDFEGDGDLDAWMVGIGDAFGPQPNFRLAANSGSGSFTPQTTLSYPSVVTMALGDMESDGDLDVVVVARDSGVVRVYLNSAGVLAAPLVVNLADGQLDVALADLDADLDLDIVTVWVEGVIVTWNNGGSFTTAPRIEIDQAARLTVGDFDGDGAPDLAIVSGPQNLNRLDLLRGGCSGILGSFCFGDGSGTACPCGNAGAAGVGCATSLGVGALLAATGSASIGADDLGFLATGVLPGQSAVLFAATNALNGGAGVPFGAGLRCTGGSLRRLGLVTPDAFGHASWGPGIATQGGWSAGDLRRFQVGFRDSGSSCGGGFNLTQAIEVRFGP